MGGIRGEQCCERGSSVAAKVRRGRFAGSARLPPAAWRSVRLQVV